MRKLLRTLATVAVLVSAAALMGPSPVWAQHGGGHGGGGHGGGGGGHSGGGHAGGGFGGHAGGGFSSVRPSGFSAGVNHFGATHVGNVGAFNHANRNSYGGYRPYYNGYGHNYGGYGYGHGFYRPYYGYGAYLPYAFGAYLPYYSNYYSPLDYGSAFAAYSPYDGASSYPLIATYGSDNIPLTGDTQAASPSSDDRPPPDNLAHLQLTVPENAAVLIDGTSTTQTGSVREFVTPALAPGSRYSYKIAVRYTDAQGKVVEDARDIRFRANDWFSIDFTRPQPQQQVPATPLLPKAAKEE